MRPPDQIGYIKMKACKNFFFFLQKNRKFCQDDSIVPSFITFSSKIGTCTCLSSQILTLTLNLTLTLTQHSFAHGQPLFRFRWRICVFPSKTMSSHLRSNIIQSKDINLATLLLPSTGKWLSVVTWQSFSKQQQKNLGLCYL